MRVLVLVLTRGIRGTLLVEWDYHLGIWRRWDLGIGSWMCRDYLRLLRFDRCCTRRNDVYLLGRI